MSEQNTKTYENIIAAIRYFIDTKRYGPVDRMAMAMGSESIEIALYDILRTIDSLYARSILVEIEKDNKIYKIRCCEYGEDLGFGMKGKIVKIYEGPKELMGKTIYCQPCPPKPHENEIHSFLNDVQEDLSIARKIVLKAFGRRGG